MSKIAGINDADPRAPEWRRMLAQIRAEHPEHVATAQSFYDKLPFDPSPFEHFHGALMAGGRTLTGDALAEAMGWNAPHFCGKIRGIN